MPDRLEEKHCLIQQQQESAQRYHRQNNPLGQTKGRCDLQADKPGKLAARKNHDQRQQDGQPVNEQTADILPDGRETACEDINTRMQAMISGNGRTEKAKPNQHITGQLFGPEQ